MSAHEQDNDTPDQLTVLKGRADLLGISYHPSIGLDKLREKIAAAMSEEKSEITSVDQLSNKARQELFNEANELIRIRVTCMNPAKREWEGEIFTVSNTVVGTFKKFVPFNADDGWHVPRIIYNQMVDRQCQVFYSAKDDKGNSVRRGKLIKEFAIEVLPKLTEEELKELAQRQAMANGTASV
jgi:hypothetical protein